MKTYSGKFIRQILAVSLLIGIPVVMIIFNGTRAMDGILWAKGQETINEERHGYREIDFGFYDPGHQWERAHPWKYELAYISWLQFHPDSLQNRLKQIIQSGLRPVLTVEPWALDGSPVLDDILTGDYDTVISGLQAAFRDLEDTMIISWGHEMDQDLTERYPWSGKDPKTFVKAYRYVHGKFEDTAFKLKWAWAPVAKETTHSYWPGSGFVDYVGVPVYAFPAWDIQHYGHIRDFEITMREKYKIIKRYEKPLMIIEFGVSGEYDFKRYWLQRAFTRFNEFPLLQSVIFFNAEDTPGVWGGDMSTPDWRMDHELAKHLVVDYLEDRPQQ